MNMHYEMFLTIQLMHLTCRNTMYNHLKEKKDETCSEEQVTTIQERIQDENDMTILSKKEEISDTLQLCDTVERHH